MNLENGPNSSCKVIQPNPHRWHTMWKSWWVLRYILPPGFFLTLLSSLSTQTPVVGILQYNPQYLWYFTYTYHTNFFYSTELASLLYTIYMYSNVVSPDSHYMHHYVIQYCAATEFIPIQVLHTRFIQYWIHTLWTITESSTVLRFHSFLCDMTHISLRLLFPPLSTIAFTVV